MAIAQSPVPCVSLSQVSAGDLCVVIERWCHLAKARRQPQRPATTGASPGLRRAARARLERMHAIRC